MASNQTAFTNCQGLIIDRTVSPGEVLGQGCLIAESRFVACAAGVFNYADAPWALAVKFPFLDLTYGVKSVTLHPAFDKQAARSAYLSQTGLPADHLVCLQNDIAYLDIDPELPAVDRQKAKELNERLTLPLPIESADLAGAVRDGESASAIERVLALSQEGLLTFYDERKRPVARLAIRQDAEKPISRAIYKLLAGELAVFELMAASQHGMFLFQPGKSFNWPNIPEIETAAGKIIMQGKKRAGELPELMQSLGGASACYVKTAGQYDPAAVHPNARWIVERLWVVLDGFIRLDKISQRIGADTYTGLRAIEEMLRLGIIARQTVSPFPGAGKAATPLAMLPPQDLAVSEPLTGFYLDPLSSKPVLLAGSFQGRSPLNRNILLHNIAFPPNAPGGIVVKNDFLVAISSGPFIAGGQSVPSGKLYQMMAVEALTESIETPKPAARIGRFICPACRALNVQSGLCKQCGADVETGQMPAPAEGQRSLRNLQRPPMLTARQLALAGGAVVFLITLAMIIAGGHKDAAPTAPAAVNGSLPAASGNDKKVTADTAIKIASQFADFQSTPPAGFSYSDASGETGAAASFAITSDEKNQNILCVVMDTTAAVDHLDLVATKLPYCDYKPNETIKPIDRQANSNILDCGPSHWGGVTFNWLVARYSKSDDSKQMVLVGAFKSPVNDKAILVIARPIKEEILDYETTLWLLQTMAQPLIASTPVPHATDAANPEGAVLPPPMSAPGATGGALTSAAVPQSPGTATGNASGQVKEASAEELDSYARAVEDALKPKWKCSKEDADNDAAMTVGLAPDGSLTKLVLSKQSGVESFDQALMKLVQNSKYPSPPPTGDKAIELKINVCGSKLKVSLL